MADRASHARAILAAVLCMIMVAGALAILPQGTEAGTAFPTTAWIRGTVTDGVNPLPNVYVKAMMFARGGEDVNYSFTNATGEYNMGVTGGLQYVVFAGNGSYFMEMKTLLTAAGQTTYSNFTLTPIAPLVADVTIKGYIKDELGNPCIGGHALGVSMNPLGGDAPYYANVTSPNSTGFFQTNVIPSTAGGGAVAFDFGMPMGQNITTSALVSGNTYWFNITLMPLTYSDDARIHGLVSDDGTGLPLQNALVSIETWQGNKSGYSNWTLTDATGSYSMNVLNGSARVIIQMAGYTMFIKDSFEIHTGDNLSINASLVQITAEIRGNVTDLSTGLPLASARVYVLDSLGHFNMASTDATGYYEVGAFKSSFTVVAEADSHGRNFTQVAVNDGDVIYIDFGLWQVNSLIAGKVTDFFSHAPINASVEATVWNYGWSERGMTDASGDYKLQVTAGGYMVKANAMSYRSASAYVYVNDSSTAYLNITMMPGTLPENATLYGWVNDTITGTGIPGAQVQVGTFDGYYKKSTSANATGYYEMAVTPLDLMYQVTAGQHSAEQGIVSMLDLSSERLDAFLSPDNWGPNVTLTLEPKVNVSWLNAMHLKATIEEPNLMTIVQSYFRYWKTVLTEKVYYVTSWQTTSFDIFGSSMGIPYTIVDGNYSVDIDWYASADGGILWSPTDELYVPAYQWYDGVNTFWMVRGYYRNGSISEQQGTAVYNGTDYSFVTFIFDDSWTYPAAEADDPTGVFTPATTSLRVNETDIHDWTWVNDLRLGNWSTSTSKFFYNSRVPTGDYIDMFIVQDFGQRGYLNLTELAVDNDAPIAHAERNMALEGAPLVLNGSASTDNLGILNYTWELSVNGTAVLRYGEMSSYTFANIGTYMVMLTVKDGANLTGTDWYMCTVGPDTPPVAEAGPNQTVDQGSEVRFDGSGSYDDIGVVNWSWNITELNERWGSGSPYWNYTIDVAGVFHVRLEVIDSGGHWSVAPDEMVLTVNDTEAPVANAGPDTETPLGTPADLDGSGSTDNVGVVNWTWNCTDNSNPVVLYGESVQADFSSYGPYIVTLTVSDARGNHDSDVVVVTVYDGAPPLANAGLDDHVNMTGTYQFDGSGSSDNVGIVSWTWTFDDGGAKTLTGEHASYQFNSVGVYIVTLNVTDARGNYDTDTMTLQVIDNVPPVAHAGADQSVDAGTVVHFTGTGSTDNIAVTNYTWTIQGGDKMYGAAPSHTFATAGTYTVVLNVSDAAGNHDEDSMTVTVTVPADTTAPTANAGPDQSVHVGDEVTFDGSGSTDNDHIESYNWSFTYDGHTQTLTGANPKFTFDVSGTYTVTLTVKDAAGNTDTDVIVITVTQPSKTTPQSTMLYIGAAAAAVAILIAALFLAMRKRGGSDLTEEESAETSEEEVQYDPGPPEDGQL